MLSDERERPGRKRDSLDVLIWVRSQSDDDRSRNHARKFLACVETVQPRHVEVEHDDVWLQPRGLFEQLNTVLDSSHHLAVRREQSPNRRDESGVVVSQQHAGRYHGEDSISRSHFWYCSGLIAVSWR